MRDFPEYVDDLPNICGRETELAELIADSAKKPVYQHGAVDLQSVRSTFAIGLHMHQPLIPAGGGDLASAPVISNLQWMMDNQHIHDNHNAPVFRWCYQRIGEFIPQLLAEGYQPRAMLEYSGTLLHGLRVMGADDVIDALKVVTCEPKHRDAVEWIGCAWGHAVAPSTPVQDYRLHVRAWQHHFAAIFGLEALGRVRGFFPAEMALPNHPEIAYEFVKTLNECGYQWVMVQEHTVELPDGKALEQRHLPHRLVCMNARGETAEIIAIIKTQGSDNKLVAQMQPYYEAKGLSRTTFAGHEVPQLVTQAADGENGGVMMNEFPPKYHDVIRECSGSETPIVNVTEYLEQLFALGVRPKDLPVIQPIGQHKIWEKLKPGKTGPKRLPDIIALLRAADDRFHVDGGSWTNDISWVRGYDNVLAPMERASAKFCEKLLEPQVSTDDPRYREALFHLLTAETSCYRYWGQGIWTDYGAELARRANIAIDRVT
ncbi:MAG: hypothetical protein JXA67_02425 [Micromonosporaceae bacterium]|nr:hypothetical protein [Micromonosporaceae bacterium]